MSDGANMEVENDRELEEGEIAEKGGASGTEEGESENRMDIAELWNSVGDFSDTDVETEVEKEVESDGADTEVEEGGIAHAVQSQS